MKVYKIYKITNLINNKIYIGQTSQSIEERFYQHCYMGSCLAIHGSINKYGKDNFKIEWICSSLNKETITELEDHFISVYNSKVPNGYNINDGTHIGNFDGETKERMSKSQIERHKNITPEEKVSQLSGVNKYIESKKRSITGVSYSGEIVKFNTLTEAYNNRFFVDTSLKDHYTRTKGYIFFYDDEFTIEQMFDLVEKAKIERKKRKEIKNIKTLETRIKSSESQPEKRIVAVNPETLEIIKYRNIHDAITQGVSSSAIQFSLRPTEQKITRHKGFHFFFESKHTIEEMFELAKRRNELIRERYLAGRIKASKTMQPKFKEQSIPLIAIHTETYEHIIFNTSSEAIKQGFSRVWGSQERPILTRRSKGYCFQYYTKSIEEHIEIVKSIYS